MAQSFDFCCSSGTTSWGITSKNMEQTTSEIKIEIKAPSHNFSLTVEEALMIRKEITKALRKGRDQFNACFPTKKKAKKKRK